MKLINRNNFISIVCITFTLVVCGKLLLEKSTGFIDRYYTENIFTCLGISVLALIGFVFLCIWIMGHFTENAPSAYKDMFVSVTIPYVAGAIVYYISFFRQIKRANEVFSNLESD